MIRGLVGCLLCWVLAVSGCRPASVPEPTPDNELPFGFIDAPKDGEVVSRTVTVTGWAVDDAGMETVRLFVNGRYRTSTALAIPRPDVTSTFPTYPAREDLHGWHSELDLGENPGPHFILVQAVDVHGATRDIGNLSVTTIAR